MMSRIRKNSWRVSPYLSNKHGLRIKELFPSATCITTLRKMARAYPICCLLGFGQSWKKREIANFEILNFPPCSDFFQNLKYGWLEEFYNQEYIVLSSIKVFLSRYRQDKDFQLFKVINYTRVDKRIAAWPSINWWSSFLKFRKWSFLLEASQSPQIQRVSFSIFSKWSLNSSCFRKIHSRNRPSNFMMAW